MTSRVTRHAGARRRRGTILVVALALVAAACSSSGGDEAADGTNKTAEKTTSSKLTGDAFPKTAWQGVTDDSIKIGVPYLDLSDAMENDESSSTFRGRIKDHFEAILTAWRAEGTLPINGRDIKIALRPYNGSPEQQRAACVGMANDDRVAFVTAQFLFPVGAECVAAEHKVPLLLSDTTSDAILDRTHPYMFSLGTSQERILRNLPHWADAEGILERDGQKLVVGVYLTADPALRGMFDENFVTQLKELGYPDPVFATTSGEQAAADANLAVQRFRAGKVGVVFLQDGRADFTKAAAAQRATWSYIDSDVNFGTTDASTVSYDAAQWSRSRVVTIRHGGESTAGLKRTAKQAECADRYRAYTATLHDKDPDYYPAGGWNLEDNSFHLQVAYHACDLMDTLLSALDRTGPNLFPDSFIAALEQLDHMTFARTLDGSFTADKHDAANFFREMEWKQKCPVDAGNLVSCYAVVGEQQPFFVP